jgi:hypothetical protein
MAGEKPRAVLAWLGRYAPAIILLLTFAVYARTLTYGFVYDDQNQIVDYAFVKSWHFVPRYFTGDVWQYAYPGAAGNYYRPLFLLWLLIHFTLFGLNPLWWHLTSVAAHLVVTFLVYVLAGRLTGDRLVGLIAALVFGLHPVHIEAVAWISAVNEPLMAIFFLLSLLCYSNQMIKPGATEAVVETGARRFSPKWMALSLVCYALALLTKETALVLPVIIFSFSVFFPGSESLEARPISRRLKSAALSVIPYLLLSAVYLAVRVAALGAVAPTLKGVRVTTILYSIPSILLFYARMLVWPVGVSLYNDQSHVVTPGLWNFFVPLAAVLVIAGVVYLLYRRCRDEGVRRAFLFSVIWIIVPLLPAMNLSAFYPTEIGHDRYLYLPSFGFSLIIALAVRGLPSTRAKLFGRPALQAAAVLVLVVSLGVGTALQHYFWKDDLIFYSYGVRRAPNNPFPRTNLADILYGRQMFSEAGEQYEQVIAIDPTQWHSQYRLGLIYARLAHPREAEQCFRRAIAINTNSANVHLYLGLALYDLGQIGQSIDELRHALEINAETPNAHYGIGIALRRQGDLSGALREFKAELEKSPEHPEAKSQIASIEEKLK